MRDFATSDHAGVQRQLDRLAGLSPGADILGLERIRALLTRIGNPERHLPPVFHVAGTNGKGSTCAFLRAAIEAQGLKAHVYTSPHLVRFNERIRLAGKLIEDEALAALLEEVLDKTADIEASFFEVSTAAALLAFSRTPADACILEVGLGGRLDATNVVPAPVACGIAQLGVDHEAFLGHRAEDIAAEKAGIARTGVPLVTQSYSEGVAARVGEIATEAGALWLPKGDQWDAEIRGNRLHYRDAAGALDLPLPRLPGTHQALNAALAIAMLRHQQAVGRGEPAFEKAMAQATWPARLQQLGPGPLRNLLRANAGLWLDGAHNPTAAQAAAAHFDRGGELHLVAGLLANKDAAGVIGPFAGRASSFRAVPVPGHAYHDPHMLASLARRLGIRAAACSDVEAAFIEIAKESSDHVLVFGSLYLAGEVLRQNRQLPT
jgi:dihydrofolate synthase/folylpolyglutamate synthase